MLLERKRQTTTVKIINPKKSALSVQQKGIFIINGVNWYDY